MLGIWGNSENSGVEDPQGTGFKTVVDAYGKVHQLQCLECGPSRGVVFNVWSRGLVCSPLHAFTFLSGCGGGEPKNVTWDSYLRFKF